MPSQVNDAGRTSHVNGRVAVVVMVQHHLKKVAAEMIARLPIQYDGTQDLLTNIGFLSICDAHDRNLKSALTIHLQRCLPKLCRVPSAWTDTRKYCATMTDARRIAHLDMDAFFASVELLRYPELRGRPVVVGGRRAPAPDANQEGVRQFAKLGDYVGRGVVTTSTYEARALGVYSGMGLMQSARLAPDAILLPADFEAYKHYSVAFKDAVRQVVSVIEDRGIDEIYLDLTDIDEPAQSLGFRIKSAVKQATGLSCSIGISPNKLLSKICSDLDKPDGLTILREQDIPVRIWPLPVSKVNGIGPKATKRLNELGIHTIGELAKISLPMLQQQFGSQYGLWLNQAAQGIDHRPLVTSREPKSLSRETTFERNLHVRHDRAELTAIVDGLCQRVADDLKRKNLICKTVGLKVKFADFSVVTRDVSVGRALQSASELRAALGDCLRRVQWHDRIRLLGVKASALQSDSQVEEPSPQLTFWQSQSS